MYQFYYADKQKHKKAVYRKSVKEVFEVKAIRPSMWEEHCLECSAPLCYSTCPYYLARRDGRCMRFENGYELRKNEKASNRYSARIKFREWGNMMTIIFPAMLACDDYQNLNNKNQKLGYKLYTIAHSRLPIKVKWESIRTIEYLRRRKLRKLTGMENTADAFIFHGYSFEKQMFHLVVEVYEDHAPVFKTSLELVPGENLIILDKRQLDNACNTSGNLVKIYPEDNLSVELEILWCDFVQGKRIEEEKSADKVKCLVWDLDNTLWNGTLIETDKPDELQLNPGVLDVIKQLDSRGVIQSIASKNDESAVLAILERLGIKDYFLYPQIHWNAKSGSMEQIAKSLNIGIDALALIDDSIFERNQVLSVWPQVRVYDITELNGLLQRSEFDLIVTEESSKRRLMYQAEEKRNILKSEDNSDTLAFLEKCHLNIEVFEPMIESEFRRCYELVVRTNQLNMSGRKYTESEFKEVLKKDGRKNFAFSCKDDFGTYGIVGYGQYEIDSEVLVMIEFAMSCRVAGKYVESALFAYLLEKENLSEGRFHINKTKKNVLLRNTVEGIGFQVIENREKDITYSFTDNLEYKSLIQITERTNG